MKKTMWQKIYSFFGFWHYYETTSNGNLLTQRKLSSITFNIVSGLMILFLI